MVERGPKLSKAIIQAQSTITAGVRH
jgi:hypothetical protein